MTKPKYEELLQGSTLWNFKYQDLTYQLSFHSYSKEFNPSGIWCYYLLVPQQMYAHRWDEMRHKSSEYQCGPDVFEVLDFHGGITFCNVEEFRDKSGEKQEALKVGCDYNHLWDAEAGYPDTFMSVKSDAECVAKQFLKNNPDYNMRCRWSGVWDKKENFYESVGGWFVHKDSEVPCEYDKWKPKKE